MSWSVLEWIGHFTSTLYVALSVRSYVGGLEEGAVISVATVLTVHAQCEEPLSIVCVYTYI